MASIKGKVVIVTGASSGIGAATARHFGHAGARIALVARRVEKLEALENEINALGNGAEAESIPADLSDLAAIQSMVGKTIDRFGHIDVLLNNAGFGRLKWLEEFDPVKDIEAQIRVNVLGVIQTTRQVLPHFIEQKSGHIINMCSIAGKVATPTYTIYAACKHAVHGFTEALRREVGVWGIKVGAIYPGGVATEFSSHTSAQRKTGISTPKWMLLTADDVANAVVRMVRSPRPERVMPGLQRVSIFLNRITPWIVDRTTRNRFVIPEREEELRAAGLL